MMTYLHTCIEELEEEELKRISLITTKDLLMRMISKKRPKRLKKDGIMETH